MGDDEGVITDILLKEILTRTTVDSTQLSNDNSRYKETYLSYVFIHESDRYQYGNLVEDLENSFTQGQDNYPKNLTADFNLLIYWKHSPAHKPNIGARDKDVIAFN